MIQFLSSLLFVIDVIAAVLLIAIIMIQQSKSGGGIGAISGGGSGGMGESVLGPSAGNIITRTTVILASVFLVCTLFLAVLSKYKTEDVSIAEKLQKQEQASEVKKTVSGDGEADTVEESGNDADKEQPSNVSSERTGSTAGKGPNTDAPSDEKGDTP